MLDSVPVQPTVEYILYATCTLGIVGALFIIVTYLLFSEIRNRFGIGLLFWLSVSNLFCCLAFFPWDIDNFLCMTQALVIHFFQVGSFFWSTYIGVSVFAVIYLDKMIDSSDLSTKMRWFHAIAWIIAFVTSFPPFITGQYSKSESEMEPWCYTPNGENWARLLVYTPCALTLLFSIGIFIAVRVKLSTWHSPEGKMLKNNITFYVASFVISQAPNLINRIQNYFVPGAPLFILVIIQITLQPLQSFWNAIIFGITEPDCLELYSLLSVRRCWKWKRQTAEHSRETANLINYDYDYDCDDVSAPLNGDSGESV